MNQSPNRWKALTLIYGAALVVGVIFLIVKGVHHGSNTTATSASTTAYDTVVIADKSVVGRGVTSDRFDDLGKKLYGKVRYNVTSPRPSYDGVIRAGSVNTGGTTDAPIVTFLVDIPELKQSYVAEVDGNQDSEYKGTHAYCPKPEQNKYPSFKCVDLQ